MSTTSDVAAIYCRLSKEDLDKLNEESESIQNQKLLLMDHAIQQGFRIHNVYVDEDYSGFSDRPQFKQMIADARRGQFNIVLCKHQSRFTRDMELVEKYIHGLFAERGIRFISLTDNVDTAVRGNKKARQINGLINEWYSEDLSENIRAVFRKKMQDGQYIGAFACYGYSKDPKDNHRLMIDEEAAQIVREIYALYLDGCGASRIALSLTHRSILTPTQHKQQQGLNFVHYYSSVYSERYGAWSVNTVRRILRNEVYIGTMIQGRDRKISYKSKKVVPAPRNEWIIVPNNHEPIVSEKDFYAVQQLMNRKRSSQGYDENKQRAKPHLLAGKLFCADCGATMQRSGTSRDGVTHYIRCRTAAKTNRKECTLHSIRQETIEAAVKERIQDLIDGALSNDGDNEIVAAAIAQLDTTKSLYAMKQKKLEEKTAQTVTLQRNLTMAYTDKLNGFISESDYLSFRAAFEEERQAILADIKLLETELEAAEAQRRSCGNIEALVKKHRRVDVLTHELINDFIDTILVGEKNPDTNEQEITINWLL